MEEILRRTKKTDEDLKTELAKFYLKAFGCRTRAEARAWLRAEKKISMRSGG